MWTTSILLGVYLAETHPSFVLHAREKFVQLTGYDCPFASKISIYHAHHLIASTGGAFFHEQTTGRGGGILQNARPSRLRTAGFHPFRDH